MKKQKFVVISGSFQFHQVFVCSEMFSASLCLMRGRHRAKRPYSRYSASNKCLLFSINSEINAGSRSVNVSNLMRPGSKRSRNLATINSPSQIVHLQTQ